MKPAPTSWCAIYSPKYKGKVTVPDNPIQIADAALYLSKTQPSLGIKDPYELNQKQFDAAVNLLKKQRPLIKKYWALASDEIDLFKNGDAVIGASWPYQTNTLVADKVPVKDLIPKEGATGWADTWMLSAKAKHPNCAYMWMKWVSTPKVQAQQAIYFGETPANPKACPIMDKLSKGSAAQYHCGASRGVLQLDQVLEDAGRRLRQRQEGLHGLHAVAAGLDAAEGLSGAAAGPAPSGGPAPPLRLLLAAPLGEGAAPARPAARSRSALVYLAALVALFVSSFWTVDPFTTEIDHIWNLDNYRTLWESSAYRTIALRTIGIAAAVTAHRRGPRVPARVLHGAHRVGPLARRSCSSPCCCRSGRAT